MDAVYMALAIAKAKEYIGLTSPNPPVGACLVKNQQILGIGAHKQAGDDHAEVVALKEALNNYGAQSLKGATLYVTLEPCNHHGKTPPCTNSIVEAGIRKVVYGVKDPNPHVRSNGAQYLKNAEIEILEGVCRQSCESLIAPFRKHSTTGIPWVLHKLALRMETSQSKKSLTQDFTQSLTMTPPLGKKTFTQTESLKIAHLERKKSDAILTGIGTVLTDKPLFTVRECEDFPQKSRFLAVLTSRSLASLPEEFHYWYAQAKRNFSEVLLFSNLEKALQELGKKGCLQVMVEAGPKLSQSIVSQELWDEQLIFIQDPAKEQDIVHWERRV